MCVFFLVGVVVEAVSLAGKESSLDHGEVLGARRGWVAQPSEPRNLQFVPLDLISEYELAGHGHLRCPDPGSACAQASGKETRVRARRCNLHRRIMEQNR